MGYKIASFALGPILYAQGKRVRHTLPKLPEPPGERTGEKGTGPLLRLLLIGDSSAAGVGASSQDEALLGRIVNQLSISCNVQWQLVARTGAKTPNIIKRLKRLEPQHFDIVVSALGVNDVTAGYSQSQWKEHQQTLIELLRSRFEASAIVLSGLPPISKFPALPQPLRWYLGYRADQFTEVLRFLALQKGCSFITTDVTTDASLMAEDGFHPGPEIYARWAKRVVEQIESARAGFRKDDVGGTA